MDFVNSYHSPFLRAFSISCFCLIFSFKLLAQNEVKEFPYGAEHNFGQAVAIDGDWGVLASQTDYGEEASIRVYQSRAIFSNNQTVIDWSLFQEFSIPMRQVMDIDISGDRLAVSGLDHDLVPVVQIYIRVGNNQRFHSHYPARKIYESNATDHFGYAIDLDGGQLIVGSPKMPQDLSNQPASFSIYNFVNRMYGFYETWNQSLRISDPGSCEALGYDVALENDLALVGSPTCNQVLAFYKRGAWTQISDAPRDRGTGNANEFGTSLAISEGFALIGAPASNNQDGAAYMFGFDSNQLNWELEYRKNRVRSFDPSLPGSQVRFGSKVSLDIEAEFATSVLNSGAHVAAIWAPGGDNGQGEVYTYINIGWEENEVLRSSSGPLAKSFGKGLAINVEPYPAPNPRLLVGDPGDAANAGRVFAYSYRNRESGRFEFDTSIRGARASLRFTSYGLSTLLFSNSNGQMASLIGAPGYGRVYYQERLNGEWQYPQIISEVNAQKFGTSIAKDGNNMVVGAPEANATGQVFLYRFQNNKWSSVGSLSHPNTQAGDQFGWTVVNKGNWLVVGAPQHRGIGPASGAVFVFRTGNGGISYTWHQTIIPPDTQAEAQFGYKVSMTDGLISISAPFDDAVLPNDQAGAVYIYRLQNNSWNFDEKINRTGLNGSQTEVHFGLDQEVQSLPTGGERLLIGAPGDFVNAAYGAAYVYEANNSTFSLVETLLASDRNVNLPDQFGAKVALDGDELLVGTGLFKNWDNDPRAAYYFKQDANQDWIELAKLKASDKHHLGDYDDYSAGIAIFDSEVLIGDPGDDDVTYENGAAYYYDVSGIPFPNTGNKVSPGPVKGRAIHKLSIYPNPNPGQFKLSLAGDLKEVRSIYATDLLGRKYPMRLQNSEGWVRSEASLEKGMYLLHVEKENKEAQILRLLIE